MFTGLICYSIKRVLYVTWYICTLQWCSVMKDTSFTDKYEVKRNKKTWKIGFVNAWQQTQTLFVIVPSLHQPHRSFFTILATFCFLYGLCFIFNKGGKWLPFRMAARPFFSEDMLGVRISHHGYRNDLYVKPYFSFALFCSRIERFFHIYDSAIAIKQIFDPKHFTSDQKKQERILNVLDHPH